MDDFLRSPLESSRLSCESLFPPSSGHPSLFLLSLVFLDRAEDTERAEVLPWTCAPLSTGQACTCSRPSPRDARPHGLPVSGSQAGQGFQASGLSSVQLSTWARVPHTR